MKKYNLMNLTLLVIASLAVVGSTIATADNIVEVYNKAVKSDPTSVSSKIRVLITQEEQRRALAGLLPQATLSGSFSQNNLSGGGIATQKYDGQSIRLSINQVLFNLTTYRENERWKLLTAQSQKEYQQAQSDLIVITVEKYFDVLSAQDSLVFVRRSKQEVEGNLQQLKALFKKQMVKITSVYEAQARLDQVNSNEIQAIANKEIAFESLYALIGDRIDSIKNLKTDIEFKANEDDVNAWLELAMENNASLQAAKQAVLVAKKDLSTKTYYPTANLGFTYSHQDIGYDNAPRPTTNTATISLNITQPIYDGGNISASKRASVGRVDLAKQGIIEIKRKVEQQVREYYLNLKTDLLEIKATKQLINSETKRKEAVKASFNYGTTTVNDVLNSETDFYEAKVKHQQAKYNYIKHSMQLKSVAGVLSHKDILELNNWIQP